MLLPNRKTWRITHTYKYNKVLEVEKKSSKRVKSINIYTKWGLSSFGELVWRWQMDHQQYFDVLQIAKEFRADYLCGFPFTAESKVLSQPSLSSKRKRADAFFLTSSKSKPQSVALRTACAAVHTECCKETFMWAAPSAHSDLLKPWNHMTLVTGWFSSIRLNPVLFKALILDKCRLQTLRI